MKSIKSERPPPSRCLIKEVNPMKTVWDMFVMGWVFYAAIVVPFRLAFVEDESKGWKAVGYIMDAIFLLDLVMTFFVSYYDEDKNIQVTAYKAIAMNYLKTWFIIDLVSILPIEPILNIYIAE